MGFFTGLLGAGKAAIGTSVGRALIGGVAGGLATGSWAGAGLGAGIGFAPGKMFKGAKAGIKYGSKAGWWAMKNPATAATLGLGGYAAYSMLAPEPGRENVVTGQDANAIFTQMRGSSAGVVSPVFEGSAEGLVHGLHQNRHSR